MALDRNVFFGAVRARPFGGSLTPDQVKGITAILDEWERRSLTDLRWLAYMLATVRGECGPNMLPVREGFAASDAAARAHVKRQGYKYAVVVGGHVYYGRGLVQLTWQRNYAAMSKVVGVDLVANPDLALSPHIAAAILFEGMIRGTFTGKKLSQYFNAKTDDAKGARRIINGTDKAAQFAAWHRDFLAALTKAGAGHVPAPAPKSTAPEKTAGAVVATGGAVVAATSGLGWFEIGGIIFASGVFGYVLYRVIRKVRGSE